MTDAEKGFFLNSIDFEKCNLACDVGAGAGKFSLLAAERNVDIIAIDIDSRGLKRIKSKNDLISVALADAKNIPLKRGMFDVAFMMEVVDYIPELETIIKECCRVLKVGGSLVFSFGNKSSLKSKLRLLIGRHYMHTYRKVVQSLNKAGLQIVKKEGFNWLPFNRTSENPLVPLFARIEKLSGLRSIPSLSPWVLIHAVRSR